MRAGQRSFSSGLRRHGDPLPVLLRRHGRGVAAVVVGRGLAVLGGVAGVRLLTGYLSPELFGRYKLALAGVSLVTGILVRPFIQYAMRACHDAASRGALSEFLRGYGRSFGAYVRGLGVAVALAVAVVGLDGLQLAPVELALIAAVLAMQALVEYDRSVFVTQGRHHAAEAVAVGTRWLVPIAIMAFIYTGESLPVILAAHACALAVVFLAPRLRGRPFEDERGRGALPGNNGGNAWGFAWPLMIAGCLSWLVHESDRFILGYFHGSHAVGLYAAVYGLASAPFLAAGGAASQLMHPIVFAASARKAPGDVPVLSLGMLAATLLIGGGGVVAVWVSGDWITALVLAERYRGGAPELLNWIALGYACFCVATCFDLAAYGAKRTTSVMMASGVAAATNVGLDLLLVPLHGAAGAAAATAVALCAYLLCMAGLFLRRAPRGARGVDASVAGGPPGSGRQSIRRSEMQS